MTVKDGEVRLSEEGAVHIATPPVKEEDAPATHESLGVTEAEFTKYYDADKGVYNWEAHAKEQAYRAAQADKKDAPADEAPATDETPTDEEAKTLVQKAGLDFNELDQQLAETGKISDEAMKALEEIGIPKTVVETYVSQLLASADTHMNAVTEAFGGDAVFKTVHAWADKNLNDAQIDEFNLALSDPAAYKEAVQKLLDLSGTQATKAPTKTLQAANHQGTANAGPKPFSSDAEMNQAFRDPRYRTDPVFRDEVAKRVAASQVNYNARSHSGGL